jgi:hypothetical protein
MATKAERVPSSVPNLGHLGEHSGILFEVIHRTHKDSGFYRFR